MSSSKNQTSTMAPIAKATPDILLDIADHLDITSRVSLSLVCRGFYRILFPTHQELNATEKEDVLLLLEKDLPKFYFCHHCVKLHPWSLKYFEVLNHKNQLLPEPPPECQFWHEFSVSECNSLPYHLARVVMNAHFYGPEHGVPVEMLDRSIERTWPSGVKMVNEWRAKIVNDKLLVSNMFIFSHIRGHMPTLTRHMDNYGPSICHHQHTCHWANISTRPPKPIPGSFGAPRYIGGTPRCLTLPFSTTTTGTCPWCATDYSISTEKQVDEQKGWAMRINTYQQFGSVRTPYGWDWSSMIGDGYDLMGLCFRRVGRGAVRLAWCRGHEEKRNESV